MKPSVAWYVYILRCQDGSLYTGIARDVGKRFQEHKNGTGGHYTRTHPPVEIAYIEAKKNHSAALKREYEIKQLPTDAKRRLVKKNNL